MRGPPPDPGREAARRRSRRKAQATNQSASRLPRTRSIRAVKPLLDRLLHRQSVGALTCRAAFPAHGVRCRNRLLAQLGHIAA